MCKHDAATSGNLAQWRLKRVPYRSVNPLQWRVADCLQVWKSGRVRHKQHDFLQQRSVKQLIVVHLCKKNGKSVLFFFGKHRDGASVLSQRDPAWSLVFSCLRQACIDFDLQEICWQNIAGRCRTPVAAHILCAGSVEACHWAALAVHVFRIESPAE